jgi:hypothetical protein
MASRHRPKLVGTIDLSGRDEQANREVAEILAELPADHPGRVAFEGGKDTIALTHLVADRRDLVARLMDSYWARHDRVFNSALNTGGRIMESLPPRRGS